MVWGHRACAMPYGIQDDGMTRNKNLGNVGEFYVLA